MTNDYHHGSCLCGKIRYKITDRPLGASYCHCEDCRKASGAPVVAWTVFPIHTIRYENETPRTLQFANRERTFCPHCGSPITFFDPENFPPQDHNWSTDRLPWFLTGDNLPAFPKNSPPPSKAE